MQEKLYHINVWNANLKEIIISFYLSNRLTLDIMLKNRHHSLRYLIILMRGFALWILKN